MSITMKIIGVYILACLTAKALNAAAVPTSGDSLASYFEDCYPRTPEFDQCMMGGLNDARVKFPTGDAEYKIAPLDPLFIKEVNATLGNQLVFARLKLLNIVERNWTQAKVITFKSDLDHYTINYQQTFPDKKVTGDYKLELNIAGLPITKSGKFLFRLYDYVQTVTAKAPAKMADGNSTGEYGPIEAKVVFNRVRDLIVQFTNLGGNPLFDKILNDFIHAVRKELWTASAVIFLNDMVSQAYTELFNNNFGHFPFDTFFPDANE